VKVDAVLTPTGAAPALGPAGLQEASQLQAARSAAQVDMLLDVQALQVGLRAPGLLELESLLSEHLSTRVHVAMVGKRGKVTIEFADLEDLERIYRTMTGT
jgi:hypothetical protein